MKTLLSVILSLYLFPVFGGAFFSASSEGIPSVAAELVAVASEDAVDPSERYYSQDARYSIAFPTSWDLATDLDETSLAGISPREDQFDFFRENVLVGSFHLTAAETLDDYFKGNLDYLKQQIPDLEVEKTERTVLDGYDAIRLVYSSTISGTRVKTMQVFAIKEGRGYIITAMAMEPSYENYVKDFHWIIDSFRFE